MTYSFFDNVTGITYRVIETSLGKIKIPVLEYAIELSTGDSIGANTGESSAEFFLESIIFAVQSGGYGQPIRRYTPDNFWYVDSNTFVEVVTNTDGNVVYKLHSNYKDITTGINFNGTNNRIIQVCPLLYLLHTGNNYLPAFSFFFDQRGGIIVTEPTIDHIGYMTYVGTLKAGNSAMFGEFSNIQQRDFDLGNYIYNASESVSSDPYTPGGESETGGGTGTFDGSSDDIDIPSLPTLSAVDTGFITLFNPSLTELKNLANYMWSDLFSLDTFKKLFADPMDTILGLSIVPVSVPNGGSKNVTVGNISTGVNMTVAASQYVELDCGTLNVEEYWGAYLDYAPYTKCHIYLPYIGTHPLSTDDVMGKSVHVVYHIDILSGACTAFVKCGGSVLYEFIGQVASSIPITGDNFTNVINGVLNIAGSIGTMVATGGFSAPASVAKAGLATAYKTGHMIGAGASMAQDVMSMKPQVEMSGGMSGTGGMLAVQVPYLILERPSQAIPARQNDFMGYPSYITDKLGNLSGYTEVEHIHLENIPCTELEAAEILQYLEGGVIL